MWSNLARQSAAQVVSNLASNPIWHCVPLTSIFEKVDKERLEGCDVSSRGRR
jgi:hypothetical protein